MAELKSEKLVGRSMRNRIKYTPFDKIQTEMEIRPNFRSTAGTIFSRFMVLCTMIDTKRVSQIPSKRTFALFARHVSNWPTTACYGWHHVRKKPVFIIYEYFFS